jgi:hypothetical protein
MRTVQYLFEKWRGGESADPLSFEEDQTHAG